MNRAARSCTRYAVAAPRPNEWMVRRWDSIIATGRRVGPSIRDRPARDGTRRLGRSPAIDPAPGMVGSEGVARAWLIGTLSCATLVAVAMVVITCATALYLIALVLDAPDLVGEGNGPLQPLSVGASLGVVTVGMVPLTALAGISVKRAWRSWR